MTSSQMEQNAERTSPSTVADAEGPIILFDGVCNLCDAWVQFVLRRDRAKVFRFAPLQSDFAQHLLEKLGMPTDNFDTMVLVVGDRAYTRSGAALGIVRRLGWPWPLLNIFWLVPYFLRDAVYKFIAHRRYRWFGKQECLIVRPDEQRGRFLA